MTFDRNLPYNDLPFLPPDVDMESKAILKKAITANRELAELKGAGDAIPNQAILINSIILQEARLSSEIENILTTTDELYKATDEDPLKINRATKEVLHYREALQTASVYLNTLEDIGLLESLKVGREVYYLNKRLLAVLSE